MTTSSDRTTDWGETILRVLGTAYPYGAGHISRGPDDTDVTPQLLHPAFHGSLDWHSSAHMQWSALRLLDRVPVDLADRLTTVLDARLTADHLSAEADYLRRNPGFERPYGWAWLLTLAAESVRTGRPWADALRLPAQVVLDHLDRWLPRLAYPVRHGVHANTAFALALVLNAAAALGADALAGAVRARATTWFADDHDGPVDYEPSGEDFLSSVLCEADLMRRVLPADEFTGWLGRFLPRLAEPGDRLLDVPVVHDRTDGKAVHLFGLALSRAGQLRRLAAYLPEDRAERARLAADAQVAAVTSEISTGDFMSTHWLVSFALLAE